MYIKQAGGKRRVVTSREKFQFMNLDDFSLYSVDSVILLGVLMVIFGLIYKYNKK